LQISVIEQTPGPRVVQQFRSLFFYSADRRVHGAISFCRSPWGTTEPSTFLRRICAGGRTDLEAVREEVERKLVNKAVNPQVQVALAGAATAGANNATVGANSATVGGEVNRAGIIPLRPSGSRLLDVLAEAGGAHYPAFETTVHMTRGRREAVASLQRVVASPEENVFVYPGDNIYIRTIPERSRFLARRRRWVDTPLTRNA